MASTIKLDQRSDADRIILDSQVRSRSKSIQAPTLVRPREDQSSAPLSFAQERLWFLDQINTGDVSANISRAVRITGNLRNDALQQSLQDLIDRHQSLRTTFAAKQLSAGIDSKARQWIATSSTI